MKYWYLGRWDEINAHKALGTKACDWRGSELAVLTQGEGARCRQRVRTTPSKKKQDVTDCSPALIHSWEQRSDSQGKMMQPRGHEASKHRSRIKTREKGKALSEIPLLPFRWGFIVMID